LMDRFSEYQLVSNSDVVKNGKSNIKWCSILQKWLMFTSFNPYFEHAGVVYVPPFIDLTSCNFRENSMKLQERSVTFPLLCKPLMAHGSSQAHKVSSRLSHHDSNLYYRLHICIFKCPTDESGLLWKRTFWYSPSVCGSIVPESWC
jgi:hypothetical protein